jgi:hypothetical protein
MDAEEIRTKEAEEAEMAGIAGLMDGGGDINLKEDMASIAGTMGSCEENGSCLHGSDVLSDGLSLLSVSEELRDRLESE